MSSLMYHLHRPTIIRSMGETLDLRPQIAVQHNITPRRYQGFQVQPVSDYLHSRVPLFVNKEITMGLAAPSGSSQDYFFTKTRTPMNWFLSTAERAPFEPSWGTLPSKKAITS
jgi:homogentisate 1,2-dioxygenase